MQWKIPAPARNHTPVILLALKQRQKWHKTIDKVKKTTSGYQVVKEQQLSQPNKNIFSSLLVFTFHFPKKITHIKSCILFKYLSPHKMWRIQWIPHAMIPPHKFVQPSFLFPWIKMPNWGSMLLIQSWAWGKILPGSRQGANTWPSAKKARALPLDHQAPFCQ